ncbi:MAG: hypothetical protein J7K40_05470 [candidate division Zixibacteria bacterium]|nr:hypothetical protein [candidate division Zixibacteria bacterium]
MKTILSWRKTASHFSLIEWSGVLQKPELPPEYTNTPGAKFWCVPIQRCIQLGGDSRCDLIGVTAPARLYIGTTLTLEQHESLINYIAAAVKRLREAEIEIESAETVVDEF